MKTNIAKAIVKMTCMPAFNVKEMYEKNGRADTTEKAAYEYVKDCFSDTVKERSDDRRNAKIENDFSEISDSILQIHDGDKIVIGLCKGRTEDVIFPEEIKDDENIIYVAVALDADILSGVYLVYGCDYIQYVNGNQNPKVAMKELCPKSAGGKQELMAIVEDTKFATFHMQNRLEVEALVNFDRGLSIEPITLKNGKTAKLFFADVG